MWNQWISGKDFHEFVTVQKGEQFAYAKVYFNNSTDCHPPLFYWLLHTICSFTPDKFSKWSGLSLNILIYIISAILIYKISAMLLKSDKWKFIPVIMWGLSKDAIDNCTYIRMYMLLTMITLWYVYFHIKMFQEGITLKKMISVWIMIYLGAMTHYYSLVVSFFGVLFFSLYLLWKKRIKTMFTYGIGACVSVGAMFFSYPYVVEQVTGSSTNNVGNQIVKNLFNFNLWIKQSKGLLKSLIAEITYNGTISFILTKIFIFVLLVLIALNIKNKSIKIKEWKELFWAAGICAFSFLSITFIGGEYVYSRYIYHIIPVIYIIIIVIWNKIYIGNESYFKYINSFFCF